MADTTLQSFNFHLEPLPDTVLGANLASPLEAVVIELYQNDVFSVRMQQTH